MNKSKENWQKAEGYLQCLIIKHYDGISTNQKEQVRKMFVMRHQIQSGERTKKLYSEIMKLK